MILALGATTLETPIFWLGQRIKGYPRPWLSQGFHVPGLMVNAFEFLLQPGELSRISNIGLKNYLKYQGPVFMDSGGFLLQGRRKSSVSATDVLSVYARLKPDVGAVLDHPLRPKWKNEFNRDRWLTTMHNTLEMISASVGVPIVPVVHGYTLRDLSSSCQQIQENAPDPPMIALGSLVPLMRGMYIKGKFLKELPLRNRRYIAMLGDYAHLYYIVEAIKLVRDNFPNSILHVFGVGSTTTMHILFLLGVGSVDSSGWRLKAAHGAIQLPGHGDLFPPRHKTTLRTRRQLTREDLRLLVKCRCPSCKPLATNPKKLIAVLRDKFRARAIHNAWVYVNETRQFRDAAASGQALEFVKSRVAASGPFRAMFEYARRIEECAD